MKIENRAAAETEGQQPTILLVDDSPLNLGVVVGNLEAQGYDVLVAVDGEEALKRIAVTNPDLILLDVMMPGMDGFELCRRLKLQPQTADIPVIFMTSLGGIQDKVKGFEAGAVDYITKPLQIDEVRVRIGTHLKLRALQHTLAERNRKLEAEIIERKRLEEQLLQDIAERQQYEQKLAARELEFRMLAENAPDNIIRYDSQCRVVYLNQNALRTLGLPAQELLGKTPSEFHLDGGCADYEASLKQVLASGELLDYYRMLPDIGKGERRHHIRMTPERDGHGNVSGVLIFGRDISERIQSEERLVLLNHALGQADPAFLIEDGKIIYANASTCRVLEYGEDEIIGMHVSEIDPQACPELGAKIKRALEERGAYMFESFHKTRGGRVFPVEVSVSSVNFGGKSRMLSLARDISERKCMEAALAASEREARTLVENTPDTIARYDRDCRRTFVNPAFAAQVEDGAASLLDKTPTEFPGGLNSDLYEAKIKAVFASGENDELELHWHDREGREICSHVRLTAERDTEGKVVSVLGIGRDITELNSHRKRIHQMAFYDTLTSLPNRSLFNDRLNQMLADAAWRSQLAGVMLLDLDRFKAVNDMLGHRAGDALLCDAAARLAYCLRGYDTVSRLGGDEFAILLPEVRSGEDMGRVAQKILESFNEPFLLEGNEVFISCSIGIAMYPADGERAEDLLRQADSAMYLAKRSGRNTFRFFSSELMQSASERLMLESDLRRGFARGELELYYQPKVSCVDGSMVGSEALLRWKHPQRGMVSPDTFIPIAEDCGLIVEIGEWVLREGCRTASEWNLPGMPLHKVAINLSARQFQTGNLVKSVRKALGDTACRAEWIEIEITESLLLDEDGAVLEALAALREMNVSIAIDDFGTGYSSLSYLARFPIDTLKIDRSFTNRITEGGHHAELVRAVLSIARSLNQEVVAEGVETEAQASFLRAHGCHIAQGYLYGKPVPKEVFELLPELFGRCGELAM
jgi:diguanylate cyclase (GGDEF)-like protein/PAS domain S-box-containing protein